MFLTDHPQFAAEVFRYDPAHPDAGDAAAAIAHEYAHHELARLRSDDNASSRTALALLDTLDGSATLRVCRELQSVLLSFTSQWFPGWEATFTTDALDRAIHAGLLEPAQAMLCATWLTRLQQERVAACLAGHNPVLGRATIDDARVLLALNVIALQAIGVHADEAHGDMQDIVAENIHGIQRILSVYPLPGLPRLPFPDEETARHAAHIFRL